MKAGIDCGATFLKAAWKNETGLEFASTKDENVENIVTRLREDEVTQVYLTGISKPPTAFSVFEQRGSSNHLEQEIQLQAYGAKHLTDLDTFLLVGVGSGVSYTFVKGDQARHFPFGQPTGGGTIQGQFRCRAANPIYNTDFGEPADLLMKDKIPDLDGTLLGEFVVSHFYNAQATDRNGRKASVVNQVATAIVRDIAMFEFMPDYQVPSDVVFIGTSINHMPYLQKRLDHFQPATGRKFHYPKNGEYALALGALLQQDP